MEIGSKSSFGAGTFTDAPPSLSAKGGAKSQQIFLFGAAPAPHPLRKCVYKAGDAKLPG